ncbi:hypothetical protein [Deinococcus sp.]|uniref:hypothetical protein n=1 Tax=Deinococcus sp. TaxID=47478 RepID=UPI0025C1EADD|nr:hypothetical protein [Deinococcus sp.]
MKRPLLLLGTLLGASALLASCAPSVTGPVQGRIVNSKTGQEGVAAFVRGTLQPRLNGAYAADNVTLQIGEQVYTGRTVLIGSGVVETPVTWGVGLGFGSWRHPGLGWGGRYDTFNRATPIYSGNLIARTAGPAPKTLTCQLTVDAFERGVGNCVGSDGTTYALQF